MPPLISPLLPPPLSTASPAATEGLISGTFPITRLTEVTSPDASIPPRFLPALWSDRWPVEDIASLDPRSRGNETILVVDDSSFFLLVVKATLAKAGYGTVTASDGLEALSALELGAVTAVVTDVEMPNMNGTEFTRQARQRWPRLPILIHSGNESLEREVAGVVDEFSVFKNKKDPNALIPQLLRRLIDGW